jgi:hypothetical protein
MVSKVEIGENESIWKKVRVKRHKPMTNIWVGRMMGVLSKQLGYDPGERTLNAVEHRIRKLHILGLKAEVVGELIAHEIQLHSKMQKTINELKRQVETRGGAISSKATPPTIVKPFHQAQPDDDLFADYDSAGDRNQK